MKRHSPDIHDVICDRCGNTARTMVEDQGYYWCPTCNASLTPREVQSATARIGGRHVSVPGTRKFAATD